MPYQIPTDHGLVVIDIQNPSQPSPDTVRFGVKYVLAGTMVDADFNRIANVFRDSLKTFFDPGWTLGPIKQYFNPGTTLLLREDPTVEPGTGAPGALSSAQVATVVTKRTTLLGRSNRGRVYMPGMPESAVDSAGNLTIAHVNGVNAIFATLLTDVNADADIDYMCLLHSEGSFDPPPAITVFTTSNKAGTIRKRVRR